MGLWFTELQNRVSKTNLTGTVCEIINIKIDTSNLYIPSNQTTDSSEVRTKINIVA